MEKGNLRFPQVTERSEQRAPPRTSDPTLRPLPATEASVPKSMEHLPDDEHQIVSESDTNTSPRTSDPALRSHQSAAEASVRTSGTQLPDDTHPLLRGTNSGPAGEYITGVSGGRVDESNVVGNLHLERNAHLTMNVNNGPMSLGEKIKRITTFRIQEWTRWMVVTAGITKLMEKVNSGVTWVTVKGQPGEGKTTAAYMALKALQESGRQVFQVFSPEEFTEVATTFPHSVILLDDLFGQVVFDQTVWSQWKLIILDILDAKEHMSHEKTSKKNVTIIFVGRSFVLDNILSDIGRVARYLSDDNHVVYMSKSGERKLDEKITILKAICDSKGLELNKETIETICNANGPHGFPHTCRLFVILRLDGFEIDAVKFMESPLQFLNETVQAFIKDTTKLLLFKEMVKRDGKITVSEIDNLENSHDVRALADSLLDSYLREEEDCFTFHHPSIFDCISFNLLKQYPLFVIKHCSVSFLRERLRLQSRDTHQASSESNLVVNIRRLHLRILAKRFVKEISKRNLVHVLSHPAVTDEEFVKLMMSCIWLPRIRLPFFTDRNTGNSFLNLIASSKSPQILKYLENQRLGKLSESRLKSVVYGVYQYNAIDVLTYVEQSRDTLDINIRYVNNLTPLKIASEFNQVEMVKLLLTRGARWDKGTLIEACKSGSLDVVKFLFERGATVDMTTYRSTPLTAASGGGHLNVMRYLIDKGASVNTADRDGWSPLYCACVYNKPQAVQCLLNHGADSNIENRWAETPLRRAAYWGYKDCVVVLVNAGAGVNVQNADGKTPLDLAKQRQHKQCVDILQKAVAVTNIHFN